MKQAWILGCRVDNLTLEETVARVGELIALRGIARQVSVNVDKVVQASNDPEMRAFIARCELSNADGMPVVWASRLLGAPLKERVAGIDLFEALMERAATTGWRIYLLGAREAVVQEVRASYEKRFPGLHVVGHRNGYWSADEEAEVAQRIYEAAPDILFVALGSPAKERFLARWQETIGVPFAMGVGGSFDVAAGLTRRAPRWMQRSGLEWFHRFLQEPRRMFGRYFVRDLAFFRLLLPEVCRKRCRQLLAMGASLAAAAACIEQIET